MGEQSQIMFAAREKVGQPYPLMDAKSAKIQNKKRSVSLK